MAAAARVAAASPHPLADHHRGRDLELSPEAADIDGMQPSQLLGGREAQVCNDGAAPVVDRSRHRRHLRHRDRAEGFKSSSPGETPDDGPRRGRSHHPQSLSAPSLTSSLPSRRATSFRLSAPIFILLSSSIATAAASWASSSAAFATPRITDTTPGPGWWTVKSHLAAPPCDVIVGTGIIMRPRRNHRRGIPAATSNGDGGEVTTSRTRSRSSLSSSSALLASSSPSPSDNGKSMKSDSNAEEFWESQRLLAKELSAEMDVEENARKRIQLEKFAKRRLALVSDTLFFSVLIFAALWGASDDPFTAISYLFGAVLGTAYSYGLGKYVETLGGSAGNEEAVRGAGVGQARFAFLIVLFVLLGKFRGQTGLQEIPTISGFFTYQLASLSQGLREIDD